MGLPEYISTLELPDQLRGRSTAYIYDGLPVLKGKSFVIDFPVPQLPAPKFILEGVKNEVIEVLKGFFMEPVLGLELTRRSILTCLKEAHAVLDKD